MSNSGSELWAICAYFNPLGYERRRETYRIFRERLTVPLVTAEFAIDAPFQLGPKDAERLVQVRGPHLLWQKERLLNLALEALPDSCDLVAWLDADIVFERSDWAQATRAELERSPIVQPYSRVLDFGPATDPEDPDPATLIHSRRSFAANQPWFGDRESRRKSRGTYSPGHAWAAHREMLERVGLYDLGVLGGADGLMAWASIGLGHEVSEVRHMGEAESLCFGRWSEGWTDLTGGRVGWVDGTVCHLWHGALEDRQYHERHRILRRHEFDPGTDVEIADGCLRWASAKPELHAEVAEHFVKRNEDGKGQSRGLPAGRERLRSIDKTPVAN